MSCQYEPPTYCKPAAADRLYAFDFSRYAEIEAGEFLTSATITGTPSGLTIGSGVANGEIAEVRISAGTAGTTYTLTCSAVTSSGSTLVQQGYLHVT